MGRIEKSRNLPSICACVNTKFGPINVSKVINSFFVYNIHYMREKGKRADKYWKRDD